MALPPKEDGKSVTISMPRISMAWSKSPCLTTKFSLQTMAAAAPSDVGQHWSLVKGSNIFGD